jgi:tetratricopeptide (TPR) repeat protein/predicted AlkP superfamily phosphohydrolase/phosphomutase
MKLTRLLFALPLLLLVLGGILTGCSSRREPDIWIIGFDGADWDILEPYMAKGEMPNLSRLRSEGAWGRLRTDNPMLSPILWTSIATGKTADKHGVTWFMSDAPDGSKIPVSSRNRWVRALWNIASEHDLSVGIIGWWATWPVEPVKGFMISDYVAFHSFGVTGTNLDVPGKTWPPQLMRDVKRAFPSPQNVPIDLLLSMINTSKQELENETPTGPYGGPVQHLKENIATSLGYTKLGAELLDKDHPRFFAIYYEGTDATEHLFSEYAPPRLSWVSDEDYKRYSGTLEAYWKWQDQLLGDLLKHRGKNTIVMIISDHGFRTGPERLKEMEFNIDTADKSHMPDGIVLLNGPGIKTGNGIKGADIYDVAPTVLHMLQLPVAEDMHGRVLKEAFSDQYQADHPDKTIATYETGPWDRGDDIVVDPAVGEKMEEMLRSLGYIKGGTEDAHGDDVVAPNVEQAINMSIVLCNQKKFDEALEVLEKVLKSDPENVKARFTLALTYAKTGRLEEAGTIFKKLVEDDPDNSLNYQNLAMVYAAENDNAKVLETYNLALKRHPEWAFVVGARGFALHKLGRDKEAEAALDRALKMDSRLADLWYFKGEMLKDEGKLPQAKENLQKAIQLNPDLKDALQALSGVLIASGQNNQAEALLQQHGMLSTAESKGQLGSAALKAGRVQEGLRLLQEAAPELNDPEIWGNLGMAYLMSGNMAAGAETFEKVLKLKPDMLDARAQLAAIYAQMGRLGEAEKLAREVVQQLPKDGQSRLQLGVILAMQGKKEEAREAILKARELDPSLPMPQGFK